MAIFQDGVDHSDRSHRDRKRHRQLLEEAIKRNFSDIIAEESIIGQSKTKKLKIPVKGLKEYQFIYGKNNGGSASGTGKETRGQNIGKIGGADKAAGGLPGQAGAEPGEEYYEVEITMDEMIEYMFDELELPDIDKEKYGLMEMERLLKRAGYQHKGIPPRLAKKRSVMEKIKRKQNMLRNGREEDPHAPARIPFHEGDLRYRRVREDVQRRANAVVFCIMDTSGSMDQTKKYLARSFYFLLYQFVRWKYEQVEVVFIGHTTEAKEVNEWEFFHRGEAGGTIISSGYRKTLDIIEARYNPEVWNIYAFHCSDGDNWGDDNNKAVVLAKNLCRVCRLFGYGEITFSQSWNITIRRDFEREMTERNFVAAVISKKEDIWPAFKKILDKGI